MPRRSTLLLGSALTTVLVGAPLAGPTPAGLAQGPRTPVPQGTFIDLVVAEAAGHVFVSHGAEGIEVYDLGGRLTTTLEDVGTAGDLLLSDDASTLYVADQPGRQVLAVDATTLSVTATLATGDACPAALAEVDDVLWMAGPCGESALTALDPATGTLTPSGVEVDSDHPMMTTSPKRPGLIAFANRHQGADQLAVLDASLVDGVPTLALEESTYWLDVDTPRQLAITGSGKQLLVAGETGLARVNLGALTSGRTLEAGGSVAVRQDGEVASGSLSLFHDGATRSWRTYSFPDNGRVLRGALAWGSSRVYAYLHDTSGYRLVVVTPRAASSLKIDPAGKPYPFEHGQQIVVRVTLKVADGSQRKVRIYSLPEGGRRTLVGEGSVPHARTPIPVRPLTRNTTLVVVYAGDALTDPTEASADVEVRATADIGFVRPVREKRMWDGTYGRDSRWTTAYYHAGSTARVVAKVGAYDTRCAQFDIRIQKDGYLRSIYTSDCLRPDRRGRVRLTVPSKKGYSYYPLHVFVLVKRDRYNDAGYGFNVLQFCPGAIPC